MDLWTEFEGVTIDSAFPLDKLLETQGRSAFFSTVNANGEPVLIRLVECHFDEDEILARWRGVQTLGHPNFLRIDRFGQFLIEEDDITTVYVVFERADANLGDVLERGRLSNADAAKIGVSVASALETLHAAGFVHEHVEPRNIFAVGESVKLRSDCIRETPEGTAGLEARRRDAHDLAVVLMQVLLGMPRLAYSERQAKLPAPFEELVQKGMSGEWGLAEMKAALAPLVAVSAKPAAAAMKPAGSAVKHGMAEGTAGKSGNGTGTADSAGVAARAAIRPAIGAAVDPQPAVRRPISERSRFGLDEEDRESRDLKRRWMYAGVLLAVVVLIGWISLHWMAKSRAEAAARASTANQVAAGGSAVAASAASRPALNAASHAAGRASSGKVEWRVVAFTYNRKDQAQKKAASLMQKHPALQPEVFSPSGRAPWLVTIGGGGLQRDAAYALARKAASLGLPRDTFARNYLVR